MKYIMLLIHLKKLRNYKIKYWDLKDLYQRITSQKLPTGVFKWVVKRSTFNEDFIKNFRKTIFLENLKETTKKSLVTFLDLAIYKFSSVRDFKNWFIFYVKCFITMHQLNTLKKAIKKAHKRFQNLAEEEKVKKWQYRRWWNKNLTEDEKQM